MIRLRPALSVLFAAAAFGAIGACATRTGPAAAPSVDARAALAPGGALRVAVYAGSPSSIVEAPDRAGEPRGVGYDLGRALARRVGARFEPVVFPNNAQALAAVTRGAADVTFTNASPARALEMDFSPTFMDVEKGFLVPPGTTLRSFADFNGPDLRIGVSTGSSSAEELAPLFPGLRLIPVPTLAVALEMLGRGQLDAFASNKAILFEMADGLAGAKVLDEHWGMEHFAAGIPKGRDAARPYVAEFVEEARRDGSVARAIARAGLRGTVAPVDR